MTQLTSDALGVELLAQSPVLDSRAAGREDGLVDVWFNVKGDMPALPNLADFEDSAIDKRDHKNSPWYKQDLEEARPHDVGRAPAYERGEVGAAYDNKRSGAYDNKPPRTEAEDEDDWEDAESNASDPVPDYIARGALMNGVCPPMSIVIFVVGSRGDVQPYLALALRLIEARGHRVRIATHPPFKAFVEDANERLEGKFDEHGKSLVGRIEFFDVGGDPKELMAYMVKSGLIWQRTVC